MSYSDSGIIWAEVRSLSACSFRSASIFVSRAAANSCDRLHHLNGSVSIGRVVRSQLINDSGADIAKRDGLRNDSEVLVAVVTVRFRVLPVRHHDQSTPQPSHADDGRIWIVHAGRECSRCRLHKLIDNEQQILMRSPGDSEGDAILQLLRQLVIHRLSRLDRETDLITMDEVTRTKVQLNHQVILSGDFEQSAIIKSLCISVSILADNHVGSLVSSGHMSGRLSNIIRRSITDHLRKQLFD